MTNSKLVPKRRFKEFELDSEWELKKLGDLGSVEMCKRIFKNETSDKFEIPFYKIGTFGKQADSYISREKFESYKNSFPYPKKGDLLLSASGSIGNVVEYRGEDAYFQDSNIVWLNHSGKINNTFLKQFYSIASWEGIEGTTIKRLYNKNILETKISLPSMHEQKQIGKIFQTLDSLISIHQHKLDKLKNLKKAYLSEMFPAEGERVPKRRFPGFEGEWEQKRLGEVVEFKRGLTYNPSSISKTGIRVLRSSNIEEDYFVMREDDVFVDESHISIPFVEKGDILITSANGSSRLVGKHAIIDSDEKMVHGGFMLLAKTKQYNFINALFSSNWYRRFIERTVLGGNGAIGNLSKSYLEKEEPYFPTHEEQEKIGEFFQKLDKSISIQQQKLDKLNDLKKAYLNELFV